VSPHSGILETAQFIFMVVGLAIAVQLLFSPFVRQRRRCFCLRRRWCRRRSAR
jgi:membrane-anchored protein YejM (alkaline phosphatase superfamily)